MRAEIDSADQIFYICVLTASSTLKNQIDGYIKVFFKFPSSSNVLEIRFSQFLGSESIFWKTIII